MQKVPRLNNKMLSKELKVNLMIISRKTLVNTDKLDGALKESKELVAIFKKSVQTAQSKLTKN